MSIVEYIICGGGGGEGEGGGKGRSDGMEKWREVRWDE